MSSCVERSLFQAANSTFEDLGFMLPDRELNDKQRVAAAEAAASVEFRGPVCGRLVLRLFGGVLPVLTANMLGGDSSPPEHLQRDALGELANVICGNVLPLITGSTEVFRLDAPRSGEVTGPESEAAWVTLGLEGGRAEVGLFLAGRAALPRAGS